MFSVIRGQPKRTQLLASLMISLTAKKWTIAAKVLGALGALLIIVAAVVAGFRWSYLRRAVTTTATITNLIATKEHDGDILYAPVYVFTNQHGQSVKVILSMSSSPPVGEVGDKIEVLYDPANPQDSIPNRFFAVWGIPAVLGGIGAGYVFVFAIFEFLVRRRLKRNGDPVARNETQ